MRAAATLRPAAAITPAATPSRPTRRRCVRVAAAQRAKSKRQVCCSKTLTAKPETADAVRALCAEVAGFSRAKLSDRASGVRAFDCVQDQWEPRTFHFWERYESNVALGRHNTAPEYRRFMEQVAPLLERPIGMALYEWVDGALGPASMQGGPKGEGGLDDATGASGAAGGASMKQTSRSFDLGAIGAAEEAEAAAAEGGARRGGGSSGGAADPLSAFTAGLERFKGCVAATFSNLFSGTSKRHE